MATPTTTAGAVTPELVMELLRPNEVALSSDGSRIAFAVSASFREQGKRIETRLWVGDVGGELRPGEAGSVPRFSPDGSRLAFASDREHEGRLSLWVDDRELGEIPGSVEDVHWSPDGSRRLNGVRHRSMSSVGRANSVIHSPPLDRRAMPRLHELLGLT